MVVDKKQFTHALLLPLYCLFLSGCMGAPLAQQMLSSVLLHGTDKIMADAQDAQQKYELNHRVMKDRAPDEYWGSFVTAGFQKITPIEEPLPSTAAPIEQSVITLPKSASLAKASPFVRVEVWNMLVGDEKMAVLEKAYVRGNKDIPPRAQWANVRVAIGALEGQEDKPIIFLVPSELGRLSSGQETIVELGDAGDLSIARYAAN